MDRKFKYMALALLVIQTASNTLLIKYSTQDSQPKYLTASVIHMGEWFKVIVSLIFIFLHETEKKEDFLSLIYSHIYHFDTIKLFIPAAAFAFQNNLIFIALENLPAAVYQVTYQIKILTTAIFSVLMLSETDTSILPPKIQKKKLSKTQWISLIILMIGVALVQIGDSANQNEKKEKGNPLIGFLAVLFSALSSGFSSVYFELLLKGNTSSIWVRNLQLGIWGILFSVFPIFLNSATLNQVKTNGFFSGWTFLTVLLLLVYAGGGFLVATVIKNFDNIWKTFATSLAIILGAFLSYFLFDFIPSFNFMIGTLMVLFSIYFYSVK